MNYIPWPTDNRQFYLFDTWEGLDERYLTEEERNNQGKIDHFKPYYANQYGTVKNTSQIIGMYNSSREACPKHLIW